MPLSQLLLGLLQVSVAIFIAYAVTVRIADTTLKKDVFEPRYRVFEGTGEFIRSILKSPSALDTVSDEYRRFRDMTQQAEMLFKDDAVAKYLHEVDKTAVDLCASNALRNNNKGDIQAQKQYQEHFDHLGELWAKRAAIFRSSIAIGSIETQVRQSLLYGFISVAAGLVVGLAVGISFVRLWPSSAVHRVFVSYPSRWDVREFRNCALGRPERDIARWPELYCDGRGSSGDATQGAHAFVMDVNFLGDFKMPADKSRFPWTCQSGATGELTCKDWQ